MSRLLLSAAIGAAFVFIPGARAAEPGVPASAARQDAPAGDDWPAFLGPLGTGVTRDAGLSDHWPPKQVRRCCGANGSAPDTRPLRFAGASWSFITVCGTARSSSVSTQERESQSGKSIPRANSVIPTATTTDPRCTPLLTENRCYTFGAEGKTPVSGSGFGHARSGPGSSEGFLRSASTFFGVGCTPILEGDLLIVLVGGQPNSGVVGLPRRDTATDGLAKCRQGNLGRCENRLADRAKISLDGERNGSSVTPRRSPRRSMASATCCA
jgi:outer membrane protein assembly factor BamB